MGRYSYKYSDIDYYDNNNQQYYNYNKYNDYIDDEYYDKEKYNDSYDNDRYDDNYNDENYIDENYNDENIQNTDLSIDEDLAGYFNDARLFSMKAEDENVKKKPKKIIYKIDDKVIISMNKTKVKGQILFGPYDVNKKQMYQIELEDGQLIESDDKHLQYDSIQ